MLTKNNRAFILVKLLVTNVAEDSKNSHTYEEESDEEGGGFGCCVILVRRVALKIDVICDFILAKSELIVRIIQAEVKMTKE